jgi:hypothetical protein
LPFFTKPLYQFATFRKKRIQNHKYSQDILTNKNKTGIIVFETYLKGPFSSGIFSPGVGCHKWPFCEAIPGIIVVGSGTQNHGPECGKKSIKKNRVKSPLQNRGGNGN